VQNADTKTAVDTTKKKAKAEIKDDKKDTSSEFFIHAADTTKKKVVETAAEKNAVAKTDTTKRDTISPDTQKLIHIKKFTPDISVNNKYVSGLYDPFQSRIQRSVKLDSTGTRVIISETIAGQRIKPTVSIPVEEYLRLKSEGLIREAWERPYRAYEKKESKKDLQKLMSDFTKVDIPLPSVSFLSIFGEPKIQLEVNGSVKVHAGWRNESTEGYTLAIQGNTRNEPDFSQEIQIGLNGKIGDKLTIGADWGTKRNFQYENILKIKYTGYDDEIVQSVEAGNVSMQTSPLIGGSEALFGIKAQFQIGPLKLQALASQKRSQSEQKTVTSGSQVTKYTKHMWEYSTNHYFIDTLYADPAVYNQYYKTSPPTTNSALYVSEIEVWKTTTGVIQPGKEKRGNAFLFLEPLAGTNVSYPESYRDSLMQSKAGEIIGNQRFVKLEKDVDYTFNEYTGVITFRTLVNENEGVAVAYKSRNGNFGEMAAPNENKPMLVLKMVKPPNLQPSFKTAWKLMLKNIYPLGGKKIKKEGFKLYIKYQLEGVELQDNINGLKLLQAFGFDKVNASGNSSPDNEFDYIPDITILPETGEVIFPVLEPFRNDLPPELRTSDNKYAYEDIYTNSQTMARLQTIKDKFVLMGEYSAASSSTIQIFNAVENSVKVSLDGTELKAGSDYTVEYMGPIAELTIRNPRALVAGANLSINYEQNDMVNLASKTLLGLRGMMDINKETKIGFTALNLNQQTLSDKVSIGQEPLSNSMYGIDFQGNYEIPFLTKLINNIIPTNEVSKLVINGEFAYINPDPNTKKSTINTDEGKSIAYIDDFEGSRKLIPIGANYGGWKDISFPRIDLPGFSDNKIDSAKLKYKAKVNWYNDINSAKNVTVADLYGQARADQTSREDQRIVAMDFWYHPNERGYYNRRPNLTDKTKLWGGIMRSLSATANNLVEENIQYIEFWMHVEPGTPLNSHLYVDLGQISEDVIPNGKLDTEDKNQNDAYDAGEDVGLDGRNDEDERNDTTLSDTDPSNDNYDATAANYAKINGTEGNANNIDMGRLPDTEDLNRNWFLDNLDNFFTYEIPIDTTANNPFIVGGGRGGRGWYLFRIPLNKFSSTKGKPDLRIAETVRFYVTGADADVHLRFAEINLVGNQWRKLAYKGIAPETDLTMIVQTVSLDDNKSYTSPPGLQQEVDRTKTDKTVYKNEQSLNMILTDLPTGERREIIKDYSRGLDIFNYKEMKMYVHGDEFPSTDGISYGRRIGEIATGDSLFNAQLYFRFGADTTNYYEYRMPIKPGWRDLSILFSDLTALKQVRTRVDTLYQQAVPGKPGHFYGIKGTPSLTGIKFFIVGIENPKKNNSYDTKLNGTVWINELRVLDADASPGWSYMGTASFKLADILLVNFSTQNKNPYFHKLADRFGNRNDENSWSLSTEIDLVKFLPFDLPGSNLRFTYTKSEYVTKPLYLFGTDIKVTEAAAQLEKQLIDSGKYSEEQIRAKVDSLNTVSYTTTTTETYSLPSIAIRLPADNWFNKDIINGFTFGFNYTQQTGKTPTSVSSQSWQWDANARYQIDLARKGLYFIFADIPILGEAVAWSDDYKNLKINFFPQTFSFGLSARRQFRYDLSRSLTTATTTNTTGTGTTGNQIVPSIYRDFTTDRYMEFIWAMTENAFLNLTVRYNLDIAASNAYLLADETNNARSEKEIWNDVLKNGLFGKDYAVQQTFELRTQPRLPSIWDLNKYFQVSLSYNARYNWKNDFSQKDLGKSANYDATFKFGTTLRWKSLTAPLFMESKGSAGSVKSNEDSGETRRGRGRGEREIDNQENNTPPVQNQMAAVRDDGNPNQVISDTTAAKKAASGQPQEKISTVTAVLHTLRDLAKFAFFDYEKLDFNLELQNSLGGGALLGDGNGFNNFWGFAQDFAKGPSRLFMLGLSTDLGPRTFKESTSVSDNFAQKNKIEFKTSKPLWEGADIDLTWNVNWGLNKSTTMRVQEDGSLLVDNVNATGTLERSFLTIPPVLMFSTFGSGIKKVNDLYGGKEENDLSDSFVKGFETLPILSKIPFLKDVMKYIPRPNWTFNWQGLEKFPIFNLAKRASISHAYLGSYREGWKITSDGTTEIQQQTVDFGFAPLIGLNLSFDNVLGGTLNTSVKYNTKSVYTYNAGSATKSITLALQNDMDFSASFLKSGFEIPLFGVALKNDIEFSISYTSGRSSNILYNMSEFREDGQPIDGTIRTKISPRVKYNMSQKVNISVFYERTTVKPEGASRTPPITTNLAGIDVEIRIGT